MRNLRFLSKTRALIVVTMISTIVVLTAQIAVTLMQGYRVAEQHAFTEANRITLSAEYQIGRLFQSVDTSLQAAIRARAIPGMDGVPSEIQNAALFGAVVANRPDDVVITNADGNIVAFSNLDGILPLRIETRSYFKAHQDNPDLGLLITSPHFSQSSKEWSAILSRRINHPDGSFGGIALGHIPIRRFIELFKRLDSGQEAELSLFSMDNHLVARWPGTQADYGQDVRSEQLSVQLSLLPSGTFKGIGTSDGVSRLYAYRHVGELPLAIGVGLSAQVVLTEWLHQALPSFWLIGLLLMAVAGLFWALRREWKRRAAAEQLAQRSTHQLSTSVARLEALFVHSPDALQVIEVREDGEFVWEVVTQPFADLYGVGLAEICGHGPRDCLPGEMADHVLSCWRKCVETGQSLTFQYRMTRDGKRIDLEKYVAPIFSSTGRVYRLVGSIRDVTQRNQTECNLRQVQKMELVGQLTAGVAHDFNNLLQATIGAIDILENHISAHPEAQKCLSVVRKAAFRGTSLTSRLLTVSRKQDLDPAVLDVADVFDEVRELCESTLGRHFVIEMEIDPKIWPVLIDSSQIATCLINLAVNARDAMPGGGKLLFSARNATSDEPGAPAELAGEFVVIRVSDDGIGMKEVTLARSCDPFFTTKGVGKGSGLGLPMVQGFAAQSGGSMTINSEFGKGTTVELWLPRAVASLSVQRVSAVEDGDSVVRILLVDDDPEVGTVLKLMLENGGYKVVHVPGGEEAMALIHDGEKFDALLTDYAMPRMNGAKLINEALRLDPMLPALLITGYNQTAASDDHLPAGIRVLRKPLRRDDLLLQVKAAVQCSAPMTGAARTPVPLPSNVVRLGPRSGSQLVS